MITKERGKLRCRKDESIKHRHATYTKTIFFGWLVGNETPSKCCLHFCKRKGAFTFKRCQRKYYSIESEENPSNLSEMNLGTGILRCCY